MFFMKKQRRCFLFNLSNLIYYFYIFIKHSFIIYPFRKLISINISIYSIFAVEVIFRKEKEEKGEKEMKGKREIKGIKRSFVMMLIVVMMGCNNGMSPREEFLTSIANLGKGFLDVFVTFGDMISGTLGIKADTKKSEIGKYFSDIETTMKATKTKLNEILEKNGSYAKVKEEVLKFIVRN